MIEIASPPDAVGLNSASVAEDTLPQAFAAAEARRRDARLLVEQEPVSERWRMVEEGRLGVDLDARTREDQVRPANAVKETESPGVEQRPVTVATHTKAPSLDDSQAGAERLANAAAAYELAIVTEARAQAARRAGQAEADAEAIIRGAIVEATEIRRQAAREVRAVLAAAYTFKGRSR